MNFLNLCIWCALYMQQDRSLINLHLMHTSYFLFVMVITLFCYGLIKGHPAKVKAFHAHLAEKVRNGA